jgi:hypothetical protein
MSEVTILQAVEKLLDDKLEPNWQTEMTVMLRALKAVAKKLGLDINTFLH